MLPSIINFKIVGYFKIAFNRFVKRILIVIPIGYFVGIFTIRQFIKTNVTTFF